MTRDRVRSGALRSAWCLTRRQVVSSGRGQPAPIFQVLGINDLAVHGHSRHHAPANGSKACRGKPGGRPAWLCGHRACPEPAEYGGRTGAVSGVSLRSGLPPPKLIRNHGQRYHGPAVGAEWNVLCTNRNGLTQDARCRLPAPRRFSATIPARWPGRISTEQQ